MIKSSVEEGQGGGSSLVDERVNVNHDEEMEVA